MKRTKRILSLLICMMLAVTSLPVTQLFAFADATTENIVSLQETTWENVSDAGWTLDTNVTNYITPKLDENGYFTFEHTQ